PRAIGDTAFLRRCRIEPDQARSCRNKRREPSPPPGRDWLIEPRGCGESRFRRRLPTDFWSLLRLRSLSLLFEVLVPSGVSHRARVVTSRQGLIAGKQTLVLIFSEHVRVKRRLRF